MARWFSALFGDAFSGSLSKRKVNELFPYLDIAREMAPVKEIEEGRRKGERGDEERGRDKVKNQD